MEQIFRARRPATDIKERKRRGEAMATVFSRLLPPRCQYCLMHDQGLRGRRPEMESIVKNYPVLAAPVLALCLNSFAGAADGDATVIVTATRFAQSGAANNGSVSLLTQADIARNPARSIPDLLKTLPGVDVRPLYGSLGLDAVADIRGGGEAAQSSTLVLIDGQRLNPVDSGSIKWETIPLSSIRQIEVLRGAGSVLYGDRAANGVINIITDKSDQQRLAARVEVGSFGYRALDASAAGGNELGYARFFAHDATTDGYRVNSDAKQTSAGGRLALRNALGAAFVDYSAYRENLGLPSELTHAQFDADPKQSTTPRYRIERDGWRLRPGTAFKAGATVDVEIDGSLSDDRYKASNPDWFYRSESHVSAQTLSPRLKWNHGLGTAASSVTIAGIDSYAGRAIMDSLDFTSGSRNNRQRGEQQSDAVFAQNTTQWNNGVDASLGLRRQHFTQEVVDESAPLTARRSDDINAWDLSLGYAFSPAWRGYVKGTRNFRLPNSDELFAYDPITYQVRFNGALKPQTGVLGEVGLAFNAARYEQRFAVFQQDNKDEIGYIAENGRNANLDPTRRRGAEWEARWTPSEAWNWRAGLTLLQATFSAGAYDGKNVPLVARRTASLGATWDGARLGSHTLAALAVGARPMGGDFLNNRDHLAGYATLDYQAQWNWKPWALILRVANLTDRKFSATGFSSAFTSGTFYPSDARSYSLALKADFF